MTDKENIEELIARYKQRIKLVWRYPNPHIRPLWEKTEIESKIKQLQKLIT